MRVLKTGPFSRWTFKMRTLRNSSVDAVLKINKKRFSIRKYSISNCLKYPAFIDLILCISKWHLPNISWKSLEARNIYTVPSTWCTETTSDAKTRFTSRFTDYLHSRLFFFFDYLLPIHSYKSAVLYSSLCFWNINVFCMHITEIFGTVLPIFASNCKTISERSGVYRYELWIWVLQPSSFFVKYSTCLVETIFPTDMVACMSPTSAY